MAEKFVIIHEKRGVRTETFSVDQARQHLRNILRHEAQLEDLQLIIDGHPTDIAAWLGMPMAETC